MFYSDFQFDEDEQAFLAYFEKDLTTWLLEPTESEKCEQFHNFLCLGWDAEQWYGEFEMASATTSDVMIDMNVAM